MRPSKKYFYWTFKKWLLNRSYDVAIDVASADFKNFSIIPAQTYVGVDLNERVLERGLQKKYQGAVALRADAFELDAHVAAYSVDLCISTHTISHFDEADVPDFISTLTVLNKRGGDLLFNIDDEWFERLKLHDFLQSRYERVAIRRYRNFLSRAYESSQENEIGRFVSANNMMARIVGRLLYLAEHVSALANIGDMALVMCRGSLNERSDDFALL